MLEHCCPGRLSCVAPMRRLIIDTDRQAPCWPSVVEERLLSLMVASCGVRTAAGTAAGRAAGLSESCTSSSGVG